MKGRKKLNLDLHVRKLGKKMDIAYVAGFYKSPRNCANNWLTCREGEDL